MADAKLFIFPVGAASIGSLTDLLRALLAQRLIADGSVNHVTADGSVVTVGLSENEDDVRNLDDWLRDSRADRFTLVNVVTGDAVVAGAQAPPGQSGPAVELRRAIDIEEVIRNSINNNPLPGRGITLEVINLVI